jgi:hypothetical protein
MSKIITRSMVKRLAGLELNTLLYARVLPEKLFQGSRVPTSGTPVYDVNGEVLFYRVPIVKGRNQVGYTDIAASSVFKAPLLSVSYGQWKAQEYLNQATNVVRKRRRRMKFDRAQFVAYSFPKIAVQFLKGDKEVYMIELFTWKPVPQLRRRRPDVPPSNFERWSLIDEVPAVQKRNSLRIIKKRLHIWEDICPPRRPPRRFKPEYLRLVEFERSFRRTFLPIRIDTKELHYSTLDADHHPCYELRGQLTSVWCVAASVQMILDFYRYNYAQTRIAQELRLGTINNPNGLPYSRDGDVVTVLEDLTSNALSANMNASPNWTEFRSEIRANRPLISFINGHSRTVAGYTYTRISTWFVFRGLLVYDPWPPTAGVITRWENINSPPRPYRRTFTAQLTLV